MSETIFIILFGICWFGFFLIVVPRIYFNCFFRNGDDKEKTKQRQAKIAKIKSRMATK